MRKMMDEGGEDGMLRGEESARGKGTGKRGKRGKKRRGRKGGRK